MVRTAVEKRRRDSTQLGGPCGSETPDSGRRICACERLRSFLAQAGNPPEAYQTPQSLCCSAARRTEGGGQPPCGNRVHGPVGAATGGAMTADSRAKWAKAPLSPPDSTAAGEIIFQCGRPHADTMLRRARLQSAAGARKDGLTCTGGVQQAQTSLPSLTLRAGRLLGAHQGTGDRQVSRCEWGQAPRRRAGALGAQTGLCVKSQATPPRGASVAMTGSGARPTAREAA